MTGDMTGIEVNLADVSHHGATADGWAWLTMVADHTEDLLPVVSNPKATISTNSTIKKLGKVPSVYNCHGEVVGIPDWTAKVTTDADIAAWSQQPDYGICMQTRVVRALDVDVPDIKQASAIRSFISGHLAKELPERTRTNSGKFLLAFTLPGDLGKRSMKIDGGVIEFLGTGNQFVVLGRHQSGVHYHWTSGFTPEFPALSKDQFEALWEALATQFAIEPPTIQGVSGKAEKVNAAVDNDPVAQHLIERKLVKRIVRDGRLHIACPFEEEHTTDGGDTATTYFPAHTGGYERGHFLCLHAHCSHRHDGDFRNAIGYVDGELLAEFEALGLEVENDDAIPNQPEPPPATKKRGEKLERFHVHRPADYLNRPRPEWLIKGVLPVADLGIVFGESGSGKTFFVMDVALAIDQGKAWRGKSAKKKRVVYVAAEGAGGVRGRLVAYCNFHGIDINDLSLGIITACPNMLDKNDALELSRAILASGGADVVILDTWAQVTAGGNENSGEDMGKALANCKGISRATGAMVLLVHHAGKNLKKGARGWSGLRGAADCEIEITRSGDFRMAKVTKLKDGIDGQEFAFSLEDVIIEYDEDGDEVTSCIVKDSLVKEPTDGPRGNWQQIVWKILQEFSLVHSTGIKVDDLVAEAKRTTPSEQDSRGCDRRRDKAIRALNELAKRDFLEIDNDVITVF